MLFDGKNGGTVELTDHVLIIRRQGLGSLLTQGLKGEKRIPFSSVMSVQFKEAGVTAGYIQFGIAGGIESGRGIWDATLDENTVMFIKSQSEEFRQLRDLVEERAARSRNPGTGNSAPAPVANVAEELGKLADLRDRGVLSDEEFAQQKTRLLQSGPTAPASAPANIRSQVAGVSPAPSSHPIITSEERTAGRKLKRGCWITAIIIVALFVMLSWIGGNLNDQMAASSQNPSTGQ